MVIGVTVSEPLSATYAVTPSGVTAIARGSSPTLIAARVRARRGVDLGHGVRAGVDDQGGAVIGVSAIASGSRPTRIGRPAACVGSAIGVTVPACALTTNAA